MKYNKVLQYLEEKIDINHLIHAQKCLEDAMSYESMDNIPIRIMCPQKHFKALPYRDTFNDMDNMLYNELVGCVNTVDIKDYSIPTIRANYGVGTLPSLFGLKSRVVQATNLPWVDHAKDLDQIKDIISKGVPNLNSGLGKRVLETYEYYKEQLSPYDKCSRFIKLYHPDLQGPFDAAHLIWGSDIYMAMYDTPDLVHELMRLVTETYIGFMKKIKPYLNDENGHGFNYHWGSLYKGNIVLRNDSAVNLSKPMYEEFVQPYDEKIIEAFGSGSIHFCGRADHIVFEMAETKGNQGMNFGYMDNIQFGEEYLTLLKERFYPNKMTIISYHLTIDEYQNYKKVFDTGITLQTSVESAREAIKILESHRIG